MSPLLLDLWRRSLVTIAFVGGPFLVVALAVGLVTSLIQAATQLQENVLSFGPKLLAVGLLLALSGHWLLDQLTRNLREAFEMVARVGGGS